MKFKVVEVGNEGTFIVPVPKRILDVIGWKSGDSINLVIPGLNKADYLIVEKVDGHSD